MACRKNGRAVCFLLAAVLSLAAARAAAAPNGHWRAVLQTPAAGDTTPVLSANNQELPRLVLGRVRAVVRNTYTWSIERQSSATSVAVIADGYNRQQLGYTLTFLRSLSRVQYRLEGAAFITNPSGQGSATLLGVTLVLGSREVSLACRGMPGAAYELGPAEVLECPFAQTWDTDMPPGLDAVGGFVQTSFGRAPAAGGAVPFTFSGCGGSQQGAGAAAADRGGTSTCSLEQVAPCVSVTDGSVLFNKYKDRLGQALAGPVTRSRLFETSAIQDSRLGPARLEPVTPLTGWGAVARVDDTPPAWKPEMPNSSWWTGSRRHTRRRTLLQVLQQQLARPGRGGGSSSAAGHTAAGRGSRHLLRAQQQPSPPQQLNALEAQLDAQFTWPYPQVAGDRPPLGLEGAPQRALQRTICDTRSFQFSLIWGPLLPKACGTFEVQNIAAALPTDGSSRAMAHSTYTFLQVVCPAKAADTAAPADMVTGALRGS